ncbi:MAG: PAS domain-containing sensor histidine kinase [Actinomycetota bacterium]|nr:PAS domain-containing sensor histidine kinase [Actinomycetota bacterium]
MVVGTDPDGGIRYFNRQSEIITGFKSQDVLGSDIFDLLIPENRRREMHDGAGRVTRDNTTFSMLSLTSIADGSTRHIHWNLIPIITPDDSPLLVMIGVDLTESGKALLELDRRMTAKAEVRFKAAMEQAPMVAIKGYKRTGRVTYWNRASEDLYGFTRDEALGMTLEGLILNLKEAARFREELNEVWYQGLPSTPQKRKARNRLGETRWVFSTMFPVIEEGQCVEVFCMDLDITSRIKLEAEVMERNRDLEAFAHNISHDLRAPLISLHGYATLVLKESAEGLSPEATEYLNRIISTAKRMEEIIYSLLELTSSGLQAHAPERVNLELILREIWTDNHTLVDHTGARLQLSLNQAEQYVNNVPIKQVLSNLVENALKYPSGTRSPVVEVGSFEQDGRVVIFVGDNGEGMPPKHKDLVFEPFSRLKPDEPGLGIGLSTVKRVVENWGGRIWLESSPGAGSIFYFTLPETTPGS